MNNAIDVACVGILVADVIAGPIHAFPERGKLAALDRISIHSGGNALNAAIDLAKLGARSAILGKVGADGFGDFLREQVRSSGVNDLGLIRSADCATSSSVVLLDDGGERTFLHCSDSNDRFCFEDVNFDVIARAKVVFLTGGFLMRTMDEGDAVRVLKKCREMGKITVYDTCWDAHGRWMSLLRPCLPYIDYFLPSIDEATHLAGGETDPEKLADLFFDLGASHVVIKLGSRGSYVRESKSAPGVVVPSFRVENPADTTGAGDSFCAGFVYGLAHDMPMTECAVFGNAVGAHCVMAVGASTGIPNHTEIERFIIEKRK